MLQMRISERHEITLGQARNIVYTCLGNKIAHVSQCRVTAQNDKKRHGRKWPAADRRLLRQYWIDEACMQWFSFSFILTYGVAHHFSIDIIICVGFFPGCHKASDSCTMHVHELCCVCVCVRQCLFDYFDPLDSIDIQSGIWWYRLQCRWLAISHKAPKHIHFISGIIRPHTWHKCPNVFISSKFDWFEHMSQTDQIA